MKILRDEKYVSSCQDYGSIRMRSTNGYGVSLGVIKCFGINELMVSQPCEYTQTELYTVYA